MERIFYDEEIYEGDQAGNCIDKKKKKMKEIEQVLIKAGIEKDLITLEVPPEITLGDFAFPVFPLAKKFKKNPVEIAKDLAKKIMLIPPLEKVVATGPYLNFFLDKTLQAKTTLQSITKLGKDYGSKKKNDKKIILEYSAPNTNKPMHLGHVRNNLTGISVARLLKAEGFDVMKVNWINDRGVHICKSMLAYIKFGNNKQPDKKSDHFVGDYYVLFSKKSTEDLSFEKEAQDLLRKWESGDKEVRKIWKTMNSWAYEGFKETYTRLGCSFDKWYYESEIYLQGKELVETGLKKGIFFKDDEGMVVANLESHGIPNKVVLRSDGTSIYSTADLILGVEKAKLHPYLSLYVVGNEQKLYLQQIFKIFELLGMDYGKKCVHVSYGYVSLPEGRMKSREGIVVDADDLMDEMDALALQAINERYADLDEKEKKRRATAIGMAALKFHILKFDTLKDFTFDPKESITFEGETGPYVQYTHARISSILRKFEGTISDSFELMEKEEYLLLRFISSYPETVSQAALSYRPYLICRYLLDLCQAFNEFYHKHPVLNAEIKVRDARLHLIAGVRQVIANGLTLLGIEALEKM